MKEIRDINILAIESSCDETAAAVIHNGREVRSNVISSQIELQTSFYSNASSLDILSFPALASGKIRRTSSIYSSGLVREKTECPENWHLSRKRFAV